MVRIHPGQPNTQKRPIERSAFFFCLARGLAQALRAYAPHLAAQDVGPSPSASTSPRLSARPLGLQGGYSTRWNADRWKQARAYELHRKHFGSRARDLEREAGNLPATPDLQSGRRSPKPVSRSNEAEPRRPPLHLPAQTTTLERQKPGRSRAFAWSPAGSRGSPRQARWISAWRTGWRDGPCADRPSYARLRGRRGS